MRYIPRVGDRYRVIVDDTSYRNVGDVGTVIRESASTYLLKFQTPNRMTSPWTDGIYTWYPSSIDYNGWDSRVIKKLPTVYTVNKLGNFPRKKEVKL